MGPWVLPWGEVLPSLVGLGLTYQGLLEGEVRSEPRGTDPSTQGDLAV